MLRKNYVRSSKKRGNRRSPDLGTSDDGMEHKCRVLRLEKPWVTLEWSGFTIQLVSILVLVLAITTVFSFFVLIATHRASPGKRRQF